MSVHLFSSQELPWQNTFEMSQDIEKWTSLVFRQYGTLRFCLNKLLGKVYKYTTQSTFYRMCKIKVNIIIKGEVWDCFFISESYLPSWLQHRSPASSNTEDWAIEHLRLLGSHCSLSRELVTASHCLSALPPEPTGAMACERLAQALSNSLRE